MHAVGSMKLDSSVRRSDRVCVEAAVAAMRRGVGERIDLPGTQFDQDYGSDDEMASLVEDIVDAYHSVTPCPHCDGTGRARVE